MLPIYQTRSVLSMLLVITTLLLADTAAHAGEEAEKIRVGIFTGQNNHAWFNDTPVLNQILDEAGLFETTLLISPDRNDPEKAEKWAAFRPDFTDYQVIVINYNGEMWPDHIKKAFESYISQGGQAYAFHAGNNPFNGWDEFEQMIGLLWRSSDHGKRLYFDDQGTAITQMPGEGPGASHGRQHEFRIQNRATNHPIVQDLPNQWMHTRDELYHGQRGPAEKMTVLLTAFSDAQTGGTGVHEPIAWTIPYGEGVVMTNVLGHWASGEDGSALYCAGFQTIFTRSIEWLATGKVTQAKPDDFPDKHNASRRESKPFEPLAYIYIPGVPGSDPLASCGCSTPPESDKRVNPILARLAASDCPSHQH